MGVVYRGRDPKIGGRPVAIKLLRAGVEDDELRDRFLQEAAIAGNLKHDNIVTIYDFGEHEGQPYIVMEFVEGVTLAEQIRSRFQFSLTRKLELVHDLSLALDYAHNKGVVHRDIKPANVMIDRDDVLKVLDFGIARISSSTMTLDGTMMGTPNYMSPEQVQGKTVDRRSDVFAVGLLFYELLSYQQAFTGANVHVVMSAIVKENPRPLRELFPDLESGLDAIVDRAIQKDPAARYQTMSALAADIGRIRVRLRRRVSDDETVVMPKPAMPAAPGRTPRPSTPHRQMLSKRRLEIIEAHLQKARAAFDAGDYATASDECDQAALIDPDDQRIIDLLEQSREALDRQTVRQLTGEAQACVERGELDRAANLAAQALEVNPAAQTALRVRDEIEALRQRERGRQQAIIAALARARENLASGRLESAIRAASDVLVEDPNNEEGHELTRKAFAALEERRHRDAHERAALDAIESQRREFEAGHHREAIAALEAFSPPHEVVTAAVAQMRAELVQIERRRAEEEERRRQEAAEAEQRQLALERWANDRVGEARQATRGGQFADAVALLREVEKAVPQAPGLADALREALDGQAAVEAEARRQAELARQKEARRLKEEEERRAAAERERQAAEARQREAEARAKQEAEERARREAEARERQLAEERERKAAAEARERQAAEARQREAEAQARREAEEQARREAEEKARRAAEEQARREAEEKARREAEEKARREAEERARREAEDRAKREAEARDRHLAEARERQRAAAEERERLRAAAEERERRDAEQRAAAAAEAARREAAAAAQRAGTAESQASEAAPIIPAPAPAPVAKRQSADRALAPPPPVPARKPDRTVLVATSIAVAVVLVAVAAWLLTRSSPPAVVSQTSSAPSTAPATTSVPGTSSAPTSVQPPPTSAPAVDTASIVADTRRLLRSGDLPAAARTAVDGLRSAPDARPIRDALVDVLDAAAARADTARRIASSAGATRSQDFVQGASHLAAAARLRKSIPDNAEAAVTEYVTAAGMFGKAATQSVSVATTTPTSIPSSAHTSVVSSAPSTVPATTTSTPATTTSIAATVDVGTIRSLLARYAQVSRSLDTDEMQQFYPGLNEGTKKQVDAFRKIYSYCDYTFSNIQVISNSAVAPVVRADREASCKSRSGRAGNPLPERLEIRFQKSPSGVWTIREILSVQ